MSEFDKVVKIYPRISRKDFEFLEETRQWMKTFHDDETIKDYFRKAAYEANITPGLISMIYVGHSPKKILTYPYNKSPEMQPIKINNQTLFKLNKITKVIKWKIRLDKNGMFLEQDNKKSNTQQMLYNIAMGDSEVQSWMKKLAIDIPIAQIPALQIMLCPRSDMKITYLPDNVVESFEQGIGISVIGLSIGFSLDVSGFSWFMCVEVDIQKTIDYVNLVLNINCQTNSHIIIASKPR